MKLRNERNREYNEFLRQKEELDRVKKAQPQPVEPEQRQLVYPAVEAAPPPVAAPVVMPIPPVSSAYPAAMGYPPVAGAMPYYGQQAPDYNELARQRAAEQMRCLRLKSADVS